MQKFFEVIPSGTNIEFVKNRWRYIWISIVAISIAFGTLIYNQVTTGSAVNFGIDFAGGSQVQLSLKDDTVDVQQLRDTLLELGYEGSSVVDVPDRDNEVLIRVKETLSIDEATVANCKESVATVGEAKQLTFNHPKGGSKLFIAFDSEPDYRQVERLLAEAGCVGTADKGPIAKDGQFPVDVALIGVGSALRDKINEAFGAGTVDHIVRAETVGSKVGKQLKTDGIKSMLYAIGFIFLFVMIRFDLRFAPGGIVALTHDAFLVIGAFALTGKEFNLQTIAAILTIIGYSINDTIVVFDRIRERVAMHRDEAIEETTNTALNETLSRTALTSVTTLMVVVAIYVMGSGPIKDFSFALIIGIVVGTYSSLCIATPIFLWVNRRFYRGEGHLKWSEGREGTGTLLGGDPAPSPGDGPLGDGPSDGGPSGDADIDVVAAEIGEDLPIKKKTTRRRRRRRPENPPEESD
ncbi:MAG: protein translocase subunit SecF [Nannocystaceae bacterium]|nr:protein translocase subunit SecF [Nannocystaceae bacterium]